MTKNKTKKITLIQATFNFVLVCSLIIFTFSIVNFNNFSKSLDVHAVTVSSSNSTSNSTISSSTSTSSQNSSASSTNVTSSSVSSSSQISSSSQSTNFQPGELKIGIQFRRDEIRVSYCIQAGESYLFIKNSDIFANFDSSKLSFKQLDHFGFTGGSNPSYAAPVQTKDVGLIKYTLNYTGTTHSDNKIDNDWTNSSIRPGQNALIGAITFNRLDPKVTKDAFSPDANTYDFNDNFIGQGHTLLDSSCDPNYPGDPENPVEYNTDSSGNKTLKIQANANQNSSDNDISFKTTPILRYDGTPYSNTEVFFRVTEDGYQTNNYLPPLVSQPDPSPHYAIYSLPTNADGIVNATLADIRNVGKKVSFLDSIFGGINVEAANISFVSGNQNLVNNTGSFGYSILIPDGTGGYITSSNIPFTIFGKANKGVMTTVRSGAVITMTAGIISLGVIAISLIYLTISIVVQRKENVEGKDKL